jgi:hypothetical protein
MPKGARKFYFTLEKSVATRSGLPHSFSGTVADLQNAR